MNLKTFISEWEKIKDSQENHSGMILTLDNGIKLYSEYYNIPRDDAKEYYEDDHECEYNGDEDAVILYVHDHESAYVSTKYIKSITSAPRQITNDFFELFDLCKDENKNGGK